GAHVRLDVDDENLVVVADEQGATAVGGQDPANLDRHHIVLHINSVLRKSENTSPALRRIGPRSGRVSMGRGHHGFHGWHGWAGDRKGTTGQRDDGTTGPRDYETTGLQDNQRSGAGDCVLTSRRLTLA